ncbi:MAG: hypothetical protein Q9227_007080 [Pyrenula ochraceoflavens]
MPPKDKYTDPELRDQVKQEIQDSDKGGAPGQWSARKAQFMAQEYKKRGGSYNTDKESGQDESQKNLSKWTDEEWQTKEGSGHAKKEDGTQKRYLPKKAWEKMSDGEKEETDEKKQQESNEGKQFVGNTGKAKNARKQAGDEVENDDMSEDGEEGGYQEDGVVEDDDEGNEDEDYDEEGEEEEEDDEEEDEEEGKGEDGAEEEPQPGQKRTKAPATSSKKQKSNSGSAKSKSNGTVGSKHQPADAPAPQASADRLPDKGQSVTWKALPGWVEGEVIEILRQNKEVDGKNVKASQNDPRIVMKSKSGKVCVHKPEAVYFE